MREITFSTKQNESFINALSNDKDYLEGVAQTKLTPEIQAVWNANFLINNTVIVNIRYKNLQMLHCNEYYLYCPESKTNIQTLLLKHRKDNKREIYNRDDMNGRQAALLAFASEELFKNRILNINDETIEDYLKWVLPAQLNEGFPIWSIDDVKPYSEEDSLNEIQNYTKILFYTPLLDEEVKHIQKGLIEDSFTFSGPHEGEIQIAEQYYDFSINILIDDCIKRYKGKVYIPLADDKEKATLALGKKKYYGQLEFEPSPKKWADGLPINYCSPFITNPDPVDAESVDDNHSDFDLKRFSRREADLIIDDINKRAFTLITEYAYISRKYIPFYDMYLLHIPCKIISNNEDVWLIWSPGELFYLNTESTPIHNINELIQEKNRSKDVIKDAESALEYTKLFCYFVWGSESHFKIIFNRDEIDTNTITAYAQADFDSLDHALSSITAPKVTKVQNKKGDYFEVECSIQYGKALFNASFELLTSGQIEMSGDSAILQLDDSVYYNKPSTAFSPMHHAKPRNLSVIDTPDEKVIENKVIVGRYKPGTNCIKKAVGCRFRGVVDLSSTALEGNLDFHSCIFEGGIDFRYLQVDGNVHFYNCVILTNTKQGLDKVNFRSIACRNFDLNWVSCLGNIVLNNSEIQELGIMNSYTQRSLFINQAAVSKELYIQKLFTLEHINIITSSIQNVQIYNSNILGGFIIRETDVQKSIHIEGLSINKSLLIDRSIVQKSINIKNIECNENLDFYGTKIKDNHLAITGKIDIKINVTGYFLEVETLLVIESNNELIKIGGNVDFTDAHIRQGVRITNAEIGGKIKAVRLEAGNLSLYSNKLQSKTDKNKPKCLDTFTVVDSINFSYAKIREYAIFTDIIVEVDHDDRPSFSMHGAEIGGDLIFYADEKYAYNNYQNIIQETHLTCCFGDGLDLSEIKLGGSLNITGVTCPEGGINLDDSQIAHNIDMLEVNGKKSASIWLKMSNIHCQGNCDITGLLLTQPDKFNKNKIKSHFFDIIARFAVFEKQLYTAKFEAGRLISSRLPGKLDLTGSNIHEFSFSNYSIDKDPNKRDPDVNAYILKQTIINKLNCLLKSNSRQEYPTPIHLKYSEIKWWNFETPDKDEKQPDSPQNYLNVINNDPNPQLHTFQSIEQNLVNQGNNTAADEVHKRRRKWLRQRRAEKGNSALDIVSFLAYPLKRLLLWFYDFITGGNTTPLRLLLVVCILFGTSFLFFSKAENIEPSMSGLSISSLNLQPHAPPANDEWNWFDGFWMAVRYNIPVANFYSASEWQPASNKPLAVWPLFENESNEYWDIYPEDFANLILALNWVIWPLILLLATRKYFSNREKG